MQAEDPQVLEFCNKVYEEYLRYRHTESPFKPRAIAVSYGTERMVLHKAVRYGMIHIEYEEGEGHVASICGLPLRVCRGIPEGAFMLLVARQ